MSFSVIVDLLWHHLTLSSCESETDGFGSIKFDWISPANPPYSVSIKSIFVSGMTSSLPILHVELLEVRGATTWFHSHTRGSLQ